MTKAGLGLAAAHTIQAMDDLLELMEAAPIKDWSFEQMKAAIRALDNGLYTFETALWQMEEARNVL